MRTPLLSVVIPAHDAEPWIGELLESVLEQDVEAMEVIVVDDRSADRTGPLVDAVAAADERVRRVPSRAPGGAAARNTGVAVARGEYLVFADADDVVPSGAYRAMVESLVRSGSDLAIGDHLKFSPNRTWSPTKRWYSFEAALHGTTLRETPALLTGRACWNRVFRRSFWVGEEIHFPEVGHADDIMPMTRAVVRASAIDVVPQCVYLYRERLGGAADSMSNRTDEAALLDYLREELACARLVGATTPELARQQALLVLDADGWVHVDRYFAQLPNGAVVPETVRSAVSALLRELDPTTINDVAAARRCLFALLWTGDYVAAATFAAAVRNREADPAAFLGGWLGAVQVLVESSALPELDPAALVQEGVVTAFLQQAERIGPDALEPLVGDAVRVVESSTGAMPHRSELLEAMYRALVSADADAVHLVSELRAHAPVVVDDVVPDVDSLVVHGPALGESLAGSMRLTLNDGSSSSTTVATTSSGRWSGSITAEGLDPGRWSVSATFRLSTVDVTVPVVTARMPLPPLRDEFLLQPLSDRRNGWRFLIDRRARRGALERARSIVGRIRRPRS
ncbi:glycosyltransferase family 2 protein [Curtobacterium sp. MCPF17_002]|uniref:glycosyltransferase family 2 protein n=1 Tax=Curtobacterium sp. MCPF17_002 TaxID=2175645 RepID=UPI0015E8E325|nr:glycosyltransferase family 2 protein [Curtobacterium sp. MCPF17_002]WIB78906.1 glycosyltransferase family 2 protein [Curtobacterium sp. MCPF17_002]